MKKGNLPVLLAENVTKRVSGEVIACRDVSLVVRPGQIVGVVGESGSGKTTLLRCLAGHLRPDSGQVSLADGNGKLRSIWALDEHDRARLLAHNIGFVHQHARNGLRMGVSAGANIAESLVNSGVRNYGQLRKAAAEWLDLVEISPRRIDDPPSDFSGGMQQRLQIARNLVLKPKILLMDEPTGGLDVSVQAKLLDLLRRLVRDLHLSVVLVTHDLGVARMLADLLLVMRSGRVVENGLADQVLDDPQDAHSQLLVSSALRV
jgi:putative phosphonate transport system ATP-binding protein